MEASKVWKLWPNYTKLNTFGHGKKWLDWRQQCKELRLDVQKFWATLVSEIPDTSFGAKRPGRSGMRKVQLESVHLVLMGGHSMVPILRHLKVALLQKWYTDTLIIHCTTSLFCWFCYICWLLDGSSKNVTPNRWCFIRILTTIRLAGLDGGTMLIYRIHTREYKRYILYSIQYS